jgi:hypothetical protein
VATLAEAVRFRYPHGGPQALARRPHRGAHADRADTVGVPSDTAPVPARARATHVRGLVRTPRPRVLRTGHRLIRQPPSLNPKIGDRAVSGVATWHEEVPSDTSKGNQNQHDRRPQSCLYALSPVSPHPPHRPPSTITCPPPGHGTIRPVPHREAARARFGCRKLYA